jgi:2-haloacid dehalogenase
MQRRDFLQDSILSCFAVRLNRHFEIRAQAQSKRTGHSIPDIDIASIKALCFDVIGTVVDWNTSVIKELKQIGAPKGFDIDWPKFLNAWRIQYGVAMQRVRRRDLPWMNSDGLRRMALDSLLSEFKITGLNEDEKDQLNKIWHRLKPWQDSVAGLIRLSRD